MVSHGKRILAGCEKHPVLGFIKDNWGLALNIKVRLGYKCSIDDLIGICLQAYENASKTYSVDRATQNESKYSFANHWGQHVKSIISSEKRKAMREVSFDELAERAPSVAAEALFRAKQIYQNDNSDRCKDLKKLLGRKFEDFAVAYRNVLRHDENLEISRVAYDLSKEFKLSYRKSKEAVKLINQIAGASLDLGSNG